MPPSQSTFPAGELITLSLTLANTRMDRNYRLRSRSESYVLGRVGQSCYDPFSFCCYRATLLGSPCAVVRATVQPKRRNLLTEPLSPQPLDGETVVEPREHLNTTALIVHIPTESRRSPHGRRKLFGCRHSDVRAPLSSEWFRYHAESVVLDTATGAPPTFADAADFERKARVLARGRPLNKMGMWSTWFWLLRHRTHSVETRPATEGSSSRRYALHPWAPWGIGVSGKWLTRNGN